MRDQGDLHAVVERRRDGAGRLVELPPLSGAPAPSTPPEVGQQLAAGKDYIAFFANRQACESFNQYAPGAVARAVRVACNPRGFVATPAGEFLGFGQLITHNLAAIKRTGRTPVWRPTPSASHRTTRPRRDRRAGREGGFDL